MPEAPQSEPPGKNSDVRLVDLGRHAKRSGRADLDSYLRDPIDTNETEDDHHGQRAGGDP